MKNSSLLKDSRPEIFEVLDIVKNISEGINVLLLETSSKEKVWWKCKINKNHGYKMQVFEFLENPERKCGFCYKEQDKKFTLLNFLFRLFSTFFVFSVIKTAVTIPELFSETSAIKYRSHLGDSIENEQLNLMLSQYGIFNPNILVIIVYIIGGLSLSLMKIKMPIFSSEISKIKNQWSSILTAMLTIVFGVLVTMFSIWGAK